MPQVNGTGSWLENSDESFDLRRKRARSLSDQFVKRAHWLEPVDRELVLAVFERGQSAACIATLTGRCPRRVRKQIKHLVERLSDPRVAYVIAHLNTWAPTRRRVARQLFIRGRSMRETSVKLGLTLHSVRKHRDAIEAMTLAAQPNARVSRAWRNSERETT